MAINLAFCITIVMSFIMVSQINADSTCTMPNGSPGNCIPLQVCDQLKEMIRSRIYSRIQYVRKSQCGTIGRKVHVCCPSKRKVTFPDHKVCGKQYGDRIYGGSKTKLDEHPWTAQIIYQKYLLKSHLCGGSLIHSRYVLTAAHCFNNENWKPIHVRLGEWDTTTNPDIEIDELGQVDLAPPHVDFDIENIISHQNYRATDQNSANDIALIRVKQPVEFTDFIRPICLPIENSLRSKNIDGESMEVVGWGKTENSSSSTKKLKANVPVVSLAACNAKYNTLGISLTTSQLCAGGQAGTDSCNGDSGGPLIGLGHSDAHMPFYYLSGLVSFGTTPCGRVGWPGVYIRVSSYIDWIEENIEP